MNYDFEYAHSIIRSDPAQALSILTKLRKEDPTADVFHDLLYLFCFDDRFADAIEIIEEYRCYEGETSRFYHDCGYLSYRMCDYLEAEVLFRKALSLNKNDHRIILNLALCNLRAKELERAECLFRESFEIKRSYGPLIGYALAKAAQGKCVEQEILALFSRTKGLENLGLYLSYFQNRDSDYQKTALYLVEKILERN